MARDVARHPATIRTIGAVRLEFQSDVIKVKDRWLLKQNPLGPNQLLLISKNS